MSFKIKGSLPHCTALFACGLLTVASAATNVLSALEKNSEIGPKLIAGSIALAVALICTIALAASINAFRNRQIITGTFALIAFVLAGTFSVSSALGILGKPRLESTMTADHNTSTRTRMETERNRATSELAMLAPARSSAELRPIIADKVATPGVNWCAKIDGPVSGKICGEVAELRTESARSDKRGSLVETISRIDADLARLGAPKISNPDAAAIAHVAGALGMPVSVERINVALMLLGVIILEVGGGLSLAVASALKSPVKVSAPTIEIVPTAPPTAIIPVEIQPAQTVLPLPAPSVSETKMPAKRKAKVKRPSRMSGDVAKVRVEEALRTLPANPSVRTVAAASKVPKSSVHAIMLAVSSTPVINQLVLQ